MGGEYGLEKQQDGRRAGYSPDTESFYDTESATARSTTRTLFNSTGGLDSDDMESLVSNGGTGDTQESKQPEKDSQSLEGERERLSRALATWDGYQGTEPGAREDNSERDGEKSDEEEDEFMKPTIFSGSLEWKKQTRRRKPRSERKSKQGK
jgi:hypothetical protein